jgi:hypothetical protein
MEKVLGLLNFIMEAWTHNSGLDIMAAKWVEQV